MKQATFQQLLAVLDENIQPSQRLIIYSGNDIGILKNIVITETRTFILVTKGNMRISLNNQEIQIPEKSFTDIIANKPIQFIQASDDCAFWCLFTTLDFLREALKNIKTVPRPYLKRIHLHPVTLISAEETGTLEYAIRFIQQHIQQKEHIFNREITNNLFLYFMYEVGNIVHKYVQDQSIEQTLKRKDYIFFNFINLVAEKYKEQHEIAFYASQLNITPKHLGRTIKNVTGQTPHEVIFEKLTAKATELVQKEEITIQQIAEQLHFADVASFSKFFKKRTGKSPIQYREHK